MTNDIMTNDIMTNDIMTTILVRLIDEVNMSQKCD